MGEFYKIKLNIFLVLILFISYLVPHDVSANLSFERSLTHDEKKVHDMSNSIMDEEQVTVESEQQNEYISNESKNELDPISEEKENEHDQISDETEIEDDQISNETENEQLNDYNPHVENNDANSSNSNENDITHQNKDDIKNENPEQSKIVEEEIADENPSNKSVKKEIVPKEVKKNTVKSTKAATPSILEKGVRHDSVKTLKANLKKLGFAVPGNGIDLYGTQTEKKVKEFQKYFGLSVTGKVDKKTNNKINTILKTPLQRGKSHNDTKKLKADLKAIGYPVPGNGTTFYGKDTEAVVKKFQKEQKLVVNGIADEVTLKKIASLKNPSVLENGVRHNNVKTLKVNLKKLGFTVPGNGTNFYGSQTEKKVKEFQKYFGLSVTGKVDKKTNDKILKNINSSLQRGKSNADVKQLKVDLIIIGFPVPGKGTSLFGKQTEATIKQFQKNQKLIVNGIVDDVTSNRVAQLKKTNPVVLANSVRHKKVKTLKVNLEKLGFKVPGSGTELFGSATEKKVKEFQKYYKLPVNGMVDNKTNNKINSILNSPLQKGKRHKDTIKLKTDLKKVGYPVPGNGTNLYGVETEKIVKQFQKDHKLVVNGIADDVTLAKLATLIKNNSSNIKIFIDPGHGGSDPGAMAGNLKEKDLTLDIAKRTEKYLKEYKGVSIKMSRTTDKTLTLQQRTDAANNWKADFFFSVHINSGGGTGVESFIYDKKPTQDEINKQKIIHEHISKNISDRDRGEKRANFHVLRESKMTAMLFEYYFIDTKSDQKKLASASYRDKLAKLTAEGIAKAYGLKK